MALEATHPLPTAEDFTRLSEHQQETPDTFFGGKPVLHLRSPNAKLKISTEDLTAQPALAALGAPAAIHASTIDGVATIESIDVWVSSTYLALVSALETTCVRIPYQTITVHAQEGDAVLLGLNLSDSNTPDEDLVFIQLRIFPSTIESFDQTAPGEPDTASGVNGTHASSPSQALFKAIADCQELNPDPPEEGDEEYDETAPGATGWITSENMHEFMDENGELRLPEGIPVIGGEEEQEVGGHEADSQLPLGQGAGRTRTANEVDTADGAEEESKWQRTG